MGELVRYDGQSKTAPWVLEALGTRVDWVSICPEYGAGLGTPRPPMDLFLEENEHRMKTLDEAHDHTKVVRDYCQEKIAMFTGQKICGYVLKSRSPSCGIGDATVHKDPAHFGDGLMVQLLRTEVPSLPIIRDEDLMDPAACARFMNEIRSYWENHYGL